MMLFVAALLAALMAAPLYPSELASATFVMPVHKRGPFRPRIEA
jgi:hypothetical protein